MRTSIIAGAVAGFAFLLFVVVLACAMAPRARPVAPKAPCTIGEPPARGLVF